MSWLTAFKIGRPGYEVGFDIDPGGIDIDEGKIAVKNRNSVGDLRRSVVKIGVPTIQLSGAYMTKATRDVFASLANVSETFLSFQMRDDWQMVLIYAMPTNTTTVILPNSSTVKLDAALVAAGFAGQITINGVYRTPNGTGTNYYTGGSYAAATHTITLGAALPNATDPVYITFTYKGWLMEMERFPHKHWCLEAFSFNITLVGV